MAKLTKTDDSVLLHYNFKFFISIFYRIASLGVVTFLSLFNVQSETLDTYLSSEDVEALKQSDQEKL